MATEDFTPRFQNDTANPLKVTFTDHLGVAYNLTGLTGSNIALRLYNTSSGTTIVGAGTWTIVDATNGIAQYTWNATDVAIASIFGLIVIVTFSSGTLHFDSKILEIKPAL